MSKGEEVEAYTKILKFQNKRYGTGLRDYILFLIGLIILISGSTWLSSNSSPSFSTIIFIIMALYFLMMIVTFVDFSFGFGLFNDGQSVYVGVTILSTVLLSAIATIFANTIFVGDNPDSFALWAMIIYLLVAFVISIFILTATPTRQGREEMIKKLGEIKSDIEKVPIGQLGSKDATTRGLKWLEFQQRDDGIWGNENPLYETSQVLRTFSSLKDGLNYQWKTIINGQEVVRTVEQTYFLVLEALDTAAIEPNFEMLLPFQTVTEIDASQVKIDTEVFIDFEDELNSISEWEFVKSLEDFNENNAQISDIPIIFPMALIFYLKGDLKVAQHCADIFSQTFDILIRRAQTRFSIQGEKEVSKLLLGKMYNALVVMLRGHSKINADNLLSEFSIQDDDGLNLPNSSFDALSDMDIPSLDFTISDDGPSLPSFDFESSDDQPSLPSHTESTGSGFDMTLPDTGADLIKSEAAPTKIKIETSMASIRNYIRSFQSIDGSWDANLEVTAECLYAVLDQESPESEFIKLGLHYILALQEKNGSWKNDIVLTAKILRVLLKINYSMSLGGF